MMLPNGRAGWHDSIVTIIIVVTSLVASASSSGDGVSVVGNVLAGFGRSGGGRSGHGGHTSHQQNPSVLYWSPSTKSSAGSSDHHRQNSSSELVSQIIDN